MKRLVTLAAGALALAFTLAPAWAETVLKVGDQRGGSRALMEAAGVLADLPYKIEWSEFPAAAPLLEALNAATIDTGIVGDAPFTFAVASGAPIRAIMATQQDQGGLAILVRPDSPVRTLADLKGKRIGTGRGSVGHQLVLAALEDTGIPKSAVTLSFLLPAEAKAALTSGSLDAWSTWEPYTSQLERSARPASSATARASPRGSASRWPISTRSAPSAHCWRISCAGLPRRGCGGRPTTPPTRRPGPSSSACRRRCRSPGSLGRTSGRCRSMPRWSPPSSAPSTSTSATG